VDKVTNGVMACLRAPTAFVNTGGQGVGNGVAGMTDLTPNGAWPAWSQEDDGYRGLARYVSPRAVEGLGLVIADADVGDGAAPEAAAVANVVEQAGPG
jgi:hypothetical protein